MVFLGFCQVWLTGGCHDKAREGNCIGFLDSGIYPYHPSFATHEAEAEPYGLVPNYRGKCEVDLETKRSFCNGKIIGAQHFAKAAIAFNPSADYASPLDGDEHGRLELCYKLSSSLSILKILFMSIMHIDNAAC